MNIAIIGYGTVGQGLVEILHEKAADLAAREGFHPQIVAVATRSRGTLYQPNGLDLAALHAIGNTSLQNYPDADGLVRDLTVEQIITQSNADVIVEVSPSNLETAQPALDYVRAALNHHKHVVLANKGPVALALLELQALARQQQRALYYEATVMAGTPTLRLALEALRGCTITRARGILNGTTNYMLTNMAAGLPYADALAQAQALGYAESDPTADVDGWDAAGKGLILAAALFGQTLRFTDLQVEGIASLTPSDIQAATDAGERWRLIVEVTPQGGSVRPTRLPVAHPLANVSGATNAITLTTDLLGDITLIGAGAGRRETAFGVLSDLLTIHKMSSKFD